jgi:hypothetical protein
MPLPGSGSLALRKLLSLPMFLIVLFDSVTQLSRPILCMSFNSMYKEAVTPNIAIRQSGRSMSSELAGKVAIVTGGA